MSILPKFDKVVKERKSVAETLREKRMKIVAEKNKFKENPRGCEFCPLNSKHNAKIIRLDKIRGKKIFIWGMSPYTVENEKKKELVGPAGRLLWAHFATEGIEREDCDIQNVVRCITTKEDDDGNLAPREPSKEEVYYCSKFTDKALRRSKAKVHVILGIFAAKTLLGREYKKGQTIFWSETLKAQIVCLTHPSYFLRPGVPRSKLLAFKTAIKAIKGIISGKKSSRFEFIESQKYEAIKTAEKAKEWFDKIRERCIDSKRRVAIDIENNGKKIFQMGACFDPGYAKTVYMWHPEFDVSTRESEKIHSVVQEFVEDKRVEKICHYGVHESTTFEKLLGWKLEGFNYDTYFAEYLRWSNRYSYSLEEIAQVRYPEFAGYKDIISPYLKAQQEKGEGAVDYAKIPMKILTPYNCADTHITKCIEKDTRKGISLDLLKVYILDSFVIDRMQRIGPKLDLKHLKLVRSIVPKQIEKIKERICHIAKDKDFNPASQPQVQYILYKRLKMPPVEFDRKGDPVWSTDKTALNMLANLEDCEFAGLVNTYRSLKKMDSTMNSYENSATHHNGELRTQWWLAGAETGRLRSTGGEHGVNLQNVARDPMQQNLLVSDQRWRDIL